MYYHLSIQPTLNLENLCKINHKIRLAALKWSYLGFSLYLLTSQTGYIIFGRVNVRYLKLPIRLLNNVGLTISFIELDLSFISTSTSVLTHLHSFILYLLSICSAYFVCNTQIPSLFFFDFNSKKVRHLINICHFKFIGHYFFKVVKHARIIFGKDLVVNI